MLEIRDLTKRFDGYPAVSGLSMTVGEGSVYGLVGTNGAGKSTLLRLAAGILKPEKGEILLDGERVFENPKAGEKLFFISDDAFYLSNAAAPDMDLVSIVPLPPRCTMVRTMVRTTAPVSTMVRLPRASMAGIAVRVRTPSTAAAGTAACGMTPGAIPIRRRRLWCRLRPSCPLRQWCR